VVESFGPEVIGTLDFNDGVLETIREGMCGVIANTEYGTADWVFETAPYTACGKTGTAQAGLYPNAWFVAYVPDDIAIVVMVESSREGSEIAAPIVRRILDNYFNVFREDFPSFWTEEYIPLNIPEGSTAG
jgi:penicillin-binding protein 2